MHQKPSFKHAWYHRQFALIPVNTIYEPKYINGKAQRWGITQTDNQPFTLAALYEIVRINNQIIRSMTMLTINADNHSFMSQFHRPDAEKRSVVVIPPELRMAWLTSHYSQAHRFLQPMADDFTASPMPRVAAPIPSEQPDPNQGSLF